MPNLRFPEFEGEWEEYLLKDVAEIYKGAGISKDQLSETGHLCILYGELYTKYKSEVISEVLSRTNIENSNLVQSKSNDVIIPSSGETAIDISTARCVPFSNILLGGDLNIIRLKEHDGRFLSYQLNGVRKLEIAKIAQGVSVVHLYGESLKRLKIKLPSIQEQKKISSLLNLIDERIATQNRIIEDLKQLRSAITNRIIYNLVADKKLVPFSEIYQMAGEGGTPNTNNRQYYEGGTIPFIKIDDLSSKYLTRNKDFITEIGLQKSSAWVIPANSLIYSNGATIGAVSINTYKVVTKQGILGIVPKSTVCVEYLYYLTTSTFFKKQIHRIITHGTMTTAYLKDINKIKVPLPDIEKQNNVIKGLITLSEKIEKEQEILANFLAQKKYLLHQMFI